jgi:recombination protein RecA
LVDLGVDHKVLEKKGAWIAFNGELVGQGREAAKQALRENADLAAKVKAAIIEKVGGKNGDSAAEEGAA